MSALKRRDNKNRVLQRGESQRQDGRYCYKYVNALGKTEYVYAWKLLPTDRTPKGKREDLLVLCQDFGQLKYKNFQFLV